MRYLSLSLLVCLSVPVAHAQTGTTFQWAVNQGNWEAAESWDPPDEGPPGSMDDALIIGTANVYINGSATAKNLTYDVILGPGSLGFTTDGSNGGGDLTVLETMTWTRRGGWRSIGTLTVNGTLNLQADQYDHTAGTIVNNGMATWQSGTFSGSDDPVFRNEGELALAPPPGEDLVFCFHNGLYLTNAATAVLRHTGEGRTLVQCQLENEGVVSVEAGELALSGALSSFSTDTYEGPFTVLPGGRLAFARSYHIIDPLSSITGGGTVLVSNPTGSARTDLIVQGTLGVDTLRVGSSGFVSLDGAVALPNLVLEGVNPVVAGSADYAVTSSLSWEAGSLGGTGTTTIPLDLVLDGNAGGRLLRDARTLRITGETVWTNGASVYAFDADTRTVNAGTMRLVGPASTRFWGNFLNEGLFVSEDGFNQYTAFTNRGTVRVEGGETRPAAALDGPDTGRYEVAAGGLLTFSGARTLAPGSEVVGTGNVTTPSTVTNHATWRPADADATGTLTVLGFHPEPDLRLEVELAGTTPDTEHDVLVITSGSANLGGTLDVSLLDGYVPDIGDTFAVVNCPSFCSGRFDVPVNDTLAVDGATLRVVYNATDVTLEMINPAPIAVFAQPIGGPIVIPPSGGSFDFFVTLANNTAEAQSFQGWTAATLPDGTTVTPALGPRNVTLGPGQTIGPLTFRQQVPAAAPSGVYVYRVRLGTFPDDLLTESGFNFAKADGGRDGPRHLADPAVWAVEQIAGSPFVQASEQEAAEVSETAGGASVRLPEVVALHGPVPNPSSGRTALRYDLPEAAPVRIALYDALGREVAVLVDEEQPAGTHAVAFDAAALPSGVYLARMTTGAGASQTQRLTLLR